MNHFEDQKLTPLEIWHGRVGSEYLYEIPNGRLQESLSRFLRDLHKGVAETRREKDTLHLRCAEGFDRVVFRGGNLACLRGFNTDTFPFDIEVPQTEDPFVGYLGALKIAEVHDWNECLALDLGQSGLKVMHSRKNLYSPRDLNLLPMKSGNRTVDFDQRTRLQKWIREAVASADLEFDGVCLAVPAEIRDLKAESCTYAGLYGDLEAFVEGLGFAVDYVMNDAVLTALGIEHRGEKTLVITSGFALGGAIWNA